MGETMKELSKCEQQVLSIINGAGHSMTMQDILETANQTNREEWKPQVMDTFLTRMVKRGYITKYQIGAASYYRTPIRTGRLTYEDGQGNWGANGIDIKAVSGEVYGALAKLRDYERTGLTPDQIVTMDWLYRDKCEELARMEKIQQ